MLRTPDEAYVLSQKYVREYLGEKVLNGLDQKIADEVARQISELEPSSEETIPTQYNTLLNKPQINDHELAGGSNTLLQLGIAIAKTIVIDNMFR